MGAKLVDECIVIYAPAGYRATVDRIDGKIIMTMVPISPPQPTESPVELQPATDAPAGTSDSEYVNQTPTEAPASTPEAPQDAGTPRDKLWALVESQAKRILATPEDLASAMLLALPLIDKGNITIEALNDGEEWLATATADSVRMILRLAPEAPRNSKARDGQPNAYETVEAAIVAKLAGDVKGRPPLTVALLGHFQIDNLSKIGEPMLADALAFIEGWQKA